MSNHDHTSPPRQNNLLRMRSNSPDDKVALAQRLLDPAYIRSILQKQSEKIRFNLQLQQALRASQPKQPLVPSLQLHPRHPTPTVRIGEASDLFDALIRVPAIMKGIENIKSRVTNEPKRDWKHLSTGSKAVVITQTVLMGGGLVAGILSSKSGRKELYELLRDREIPMPIPGVSGFKLQLKTGNEHKAMLMFDVAEFWRSL